MRTWLRSLLMPLSLLGILLFVLPWLWVLSAPTSRGWFVKQITGNTGFAPALPWVGSLPYPFGTRGQGLNPDPLPASLEADHLNDPFVQAKFADQRIRETLAAHPLNTAFYGTPKAVEMGEYEGLIKHFSHESWLYAHYLRTAVGSFQDGRIGGGFSSATRISPYANAPETTGIPPNFTLQQLEDALKIARQGQAAEPDNAFFGLYEGVLLWMGHRDGEAWRALHRASLLPRFDEHTAEEAEASIHVVELQFGPLIWEQKMSLEAAVLFPQYAKLREKARQWSWDAWKLERTGHHQEAITKRADLARLFAKTQHGRNSLIGGLVGSAIESIMWTGNPNRHVNRNQLTPQQRDDLNGTMRLEAQKFALYARAHSEPAIAAETPRLMETTAHFRLLTRAATAEFSPDNISPSLVRQTRMLWWASCEMLGSGVLLSIAWLATSILLIGAGGARPRARFVAPVVALCVGLVALIYIRYSGAYGEEFWVYSNTTLPSNVLRGFEASQGVALLLPLALPAVLCGVPAWFAARRARRARRKSTPPTVEASTAPTASLFAGSGPLPRDMRPLIWAFFAACAALSALGGWVIAAALWIDPASTGIFPIGTAQYDVTGPIEISALFAFLASALWLAGWIVKCRFLAPAAQRPLTHSALRRFNAVLAVLLIVSSWSYAFTLAASIGPRREADRLSAMERQLGEIGAYEATHPQLAADYARQGQLPVPTESAP